MQSAMKNKGCSSFTERYCYEVGENVVLKSTSPDNQNYECVFLSSCKSKDKCIRMKDKKVM